MNTQQKEPLTDGQIRGATLDFLTMRYEHLCTVGQMTDANEIGRVHAELERRGHSRAWTPSAPVIDRTHADEYILPNGATPRAKDTAETITPLIVRKAIDEAIATFGGGPIDLADVCRFLLGVQNARDTSLDWMIVPLLDKMLVPCAAPGTWRARTREEQDENIRTLQASIVPAAPNRDTVDQLVLATFGVDAVTVNEALCDKFRADRTHACVRIETLAGKIGGEVESYERLIEMADALVREANALRATIALEQRAFLNSTDF
jgi:hypothetical protein